VKKTLIVGLCGLLASCASLSFAPPGPEVANRIYAYTSDVVFDAVKKALFDLNADFEDIDEDSGMIFARIQTASALAAGLLAGKPRAAYLHYRVVLFEVDQGTLVKANLYYAYEDQTYKSYGQQDVYDEFWETVETNL